MDLLSYKGYYGSVEYSAEDNILCGEVLGLKNTFISYEGQSLKELKNDFQNGIDDYLAGCKVDGDQPEKGNKRLANQYLKKCIKDSFR